MYSADGLGPVRSPAAAQQAEQKQKEAADKKLFTTATDKAHAATDKYQAAAGRGAPKAEQTQLYNDAIAAWNAALELLPEYLRLVGLNADKGQEQAAIQGEIAKLKADFKGDAQDREIFSEVLELGSEAVSTESRDQMQAQIELSAALQDMVVAQGNLEDVRALPHGILSAEPDILEGAEAELALADADYERAMEKFVEADVKAKLTTLFGEGQHGTYGAPCPIRLLAVHRPDGAEYDHHLDGLQGSLL